MLEAGLRVGSYRIIGPLGEGAMGAVFEAVHESIERRVAIKVLHPDLASRPDIAARFVNEARAVNIIDHPGLVAISDYGQLPDGAPFIVMELLRGESLRARLGRGPLGDEALPLGWQVAMALAAAHEKGIVHRDLKPTNLMLVPDPTFRGGTRVKVLDFGIAKLAPERRPGGMETATGVVLGTPAYIAPEQCRGSGQVTDRADVYALGVILYEGLAGVRPFTGGEAEVLGMHLYQEPPPLGDAVPALPAAIVELVHAMLRKTAAERPSMAEVAAVLEGWRSAAGGAAEAPGPTPPSAASAPLGSTLGRAVGAVGLAEAAGAAGPAGSIGAAPARRHTGRLLLAVAPAVLLLGAAGAWRGGLLRPPAPSPGATAVPLPSPGPTTAAAAPAEADTPRLGLSVLADFHDASGARRSALAAPDVWEAAAADFARVAGAPGAPVRWRSGRALCEGRAALLSGHLGPALQAIRAAVQLEEGWATAHAVLAHALERSGDLPGAVAAIQRAAELEPGWFLPVAARGIQHAHAGQLEEAIQAFRRALLLAKDEPTLLDGLAMTLHAAHLDAEADEVAARAIARDPDVVWAHIVRAERALERGDGRAALAEAERALGREPKNVAARLARADAMVLLGRKGEARAEYEAAVEEMNRGGPLGLSPERQASVRRALSGGGLPPPRGHRGGAGRGRPDLAQRTRAPVINSGPLDGP